MNGVARRASLNDSHVPVDCVLEATRNVRGVENVRLKIEEGGRALSWRGLKEAEQIRRVNYDYDGLHGNFYFVTGADGHAEYVHTYVSINAIPPQPEIDRIRPAMTAIENAITDACSVPLSAPNTVEACHGVSCG